MRKKGPTKKPLIYNPTPEEIDAYNWGVYRYNISPLGIHDKADEYRIGISVVGDHKNIQKDPKIYAHDEVMEQVYKYYKYYYDKRSKSKEGDSSI